MRSPEQIGRRTKQLRLAADLSVEQLAVRAGVSASTISRIERGQTRRPSLMVLTRIASALGYSSLEEMLAQPDQVPVAGLSMRSRLAARAMVIGPEELSLLRHEVRVLREALADFATRLEKAENEQEMGESGN
jgi:transcriptional regulator with XRE-family HTH domain